MTAISRLPLHRAFRLLALALSVGLGSTGLPAAETSSSPYCLDYHASKAAFRQLCDFVVAEKADMKTIFIGGYYMRTLVAGYQIFGERRYLDAAVAFGDKLLTLQSPRGYWGTGYGNIYLADTGSALGLFIVLNRHVGPDRQQKYLAAVKRYVTAIENDGLINPSGAFGVGYKGTPDGTITGPFEDEYTISSALSGGEVFTWLYQSTKVDRYREKAHSALRWILSTMRADGAIPHVLAGMGGDFNKKGDAKNDEVLWQKHRTLVSTYVGEGMISFDLHCDKPEWKREIRDGMKRQIEYLLATQNPDGTWGEKGSQDQKRSPGIANVLTWYHQHVRADDRLVRAVRKFNSVLVEPDKAREFGVLSVGGDKTGKSPSSTAGKFVPNDILTALSGRALADMLVPGIDSRW